MEAAGNRWLSGQSAPKDQTEESQPVVPPYWQHRRFESYSSVGHLRPAPINLQDNTEDRSEGNSPLWAKTVSIDDYVLVSGTVPSVGNYTVWTCSIEMLDVSIPGWFDDHQEEVRAHIVPCALNGLNVVLDRYSEFEDLRAKLATTFPNAGQALPSLPPKSTLQRFKPSFLEKRRIGLAYFLNSILLNPEFAAVPVVKDFLFD